MKTKTKSRYTQQGIQTLLKSNDKALCRAIVAIYKRQTQAEQAHGNTLEHNGKGFTAIDAYVMSYCARLLLQGSTLSYSQMRGARSTMQKYWKQLIEVAEENDRIKQARAERALLEKLDKSFLTGGFA